MLQNLNTNHQHQIKVRLCISNCFSTSNLDTIECVFISASEFHQPEIWAEC